MPRQLPSPTEHQEQVALLSWWRAQHPSMERLLFAIPNGGARHVATGKSLKAEGTRAGVPDLMLAAPRGCHAGLFIELKRRHGGRVSPAQSAMLSALALAGYAVAVCHGWDDARKTIEAYLAGGKLPLKTEKSGGHNV